MIIKIIKKIFISIIWQYFFYKIEKINYINLFNSFIPFLGALSTRNLIVFLKYLIFDRITENRYYKIMESTIGASVNLMFDSHPKKLFWFGFIFTMLVHRWLILMKRILLWPFKLGLFSFFYSIFGVDLSWLLGWFYIFTINIPHWIYIQYLTLYSNWLNWWNNTVNIKVLNNIKLPSIPSKEVSNLNKDLDEANVNNKKNI